MILNKYTFVCFRYFACLYFALLVSCFLNSCSTNPERELDLIANNNFSYEETDKVYLQFDDPIITGKHLETGWKFKKPDLRSTYPWPLFSKNPVSLKLNFSRRADRLMAIKLLNLKPE